MTLSRLVTAPMSAIGKSSWCSSTPSWRMRTRMCSLSGSMWMSLALRSIAAVISPLTSEMIVLSSEGEMRSRWRTLSMRLIPRSIELRREIATMRLAPKISRAAASSSLSIGSAKATSGAPLSIWIGMKQWLSYHLGGTRLKSLGSISA